MVKLSQRHSSAKFIVAFRLLINRLNARKMAENIVSSLVAMLTKIKEKEDSNEEARLDRISTTMEIEYIDELINKLIMRLSRTLLVTTDGNRNDSLYLGLFEINPSKGTAGMGKTQELFINKISNTIDTDERYKDYAQYSKELKELNDKLQSTIAQREQFYTAESIASNNLRITKDEAMQLYNSTYHRLMIDYPKDKDLIESLFTKI